MSSSEAVRIAMPMNPDKVKFTPFVEGKLRTWYKMLNVRKDGKMSKADYEEIAQRFVKQHKLDDKRRQVVFDWLVNGWDILLKGQGGSQLAGMDLVRAMSEGIKAGKTSTEDEYVGAFGQLIRGNPKLAIESLERMVSVFFDIFDENSDGYISRHEMIVGLNCFGFTDGVLVGQVFEALDTNGDGKVSRDEYVYGWLEYCYGEDRSNPLTKYFAPHLLA